MQILCIDVGSGTQDILLLDTNKTAENAIQLVLPAPTVLVAQKIERATVSGTPIVLIGEIMGGGACTGALRKHLQGGFKAYATPEAAKSFNDDLEQVASWGVRLISHDEAVGLNTGTVIRTRDVDLEALEQSLAAWNIKFNPDAIGVAVLDHGAAPQGESQRVFRFRQIEGLLQKNDSLESFVFVSTEVPSSFTRMLAVVGSVPKDIPLVLMDTGAAAVLGTTLDEVVAGHSHRLVINVGNSHTIAFLLDHRRVMGLFEHHTSALSLQKLETLLQKLVGGNLSQDEVWSEGGHGSLTTESGHAPFVIATGPRRILLAPSVLNPYFAAPFGSMMLTGCFGLALGIAIKFPKWQEEIEKALILDRQSKVTG